MNPIKAVISVLAVLLLAFVSVGFLLPGEWRASRTVVVEASPEATYAYLDSVEGWSRWTPMPFVEGEVSGPEHGPGATLVWDDPQWGDGTWTLTEAEADTRVRYRVEVEGGSLVTRGEVSLRATEGGGTEIRWTEEGDFGWNPLLAFMALGMERLQGEEMEKSLADLVTLLEDESDAAPAAASDSVSGEVR